MLDKIKKRELYDILTEMGLPTIQPRRFRKFINSNDLGELWWIKNNLANLYPNHPSLTEAQDIIEELLASQRGRYRPPHNIKNI
tara:strand:+ start:1166 stop:1417 length:252 start_codon:yes stop_codon:yes gene_type:complete